MKMDMDRLLKKEPDLFSVRNEVKDVSDVYLEKNHQIIYSEDVNGTKSSYMDFKNFKKNKLGMVDSNQINQILCQFTCFCCKNQCNATVKSNTIFKSRINDSECILPCHFVCGQLSNVEDKAEFTRKMNHTATSSAEFDFKTKFFNRLWNVKHIDNLDLSVLSSDNVTQFIYYQCIYDSCKMYYKNKLKSKKKLSTIQNSSKISYNFANKLKHNINVSVPCTKSTIKSISQIKLIEMNTQKSSNAFNDPYKSQFSLFNDMDVSYLPVPALQLMIDSELYDSKLKLDDDFNNYKDNKLSINKKPMKRKKDQLLTFNSSISKKCQVHNKHNLQNELIKSDSNNFSNLQPIIPLSVLHYLDKL